MGMMPASQVSPVEMLQLCILEQLLGVATPPWPQRQPQPSRHATPPLAARDQKLLRPW
jgi:hypothetical protein